MTNSTTSNLTAATTPLAGTELVAIIQSGSKKVTVANLTLGRAVDTAGGTFTNNQIQGVAAKGINFTANTPAAGMTSQLLNWSEEGTWTPTAHNLTIVAGTGGATYAGSYTRVGRLVFASLIISTTGTCTTASVDGTTYFSGLPFSMTGLSVASSANDTDGKGLGNSYAFGTNVYIPTWVAQSGGKVTTVIYYI